jgi:glutathione S-transferase
MVHKRFGLLEAHLAGREFLVRDKRSIVDAYAFPMVRWGAATLADNVSVKRRPKMLSPGPPLIAP